MKIQLALIAVFAAACTGDAGTKDTGTTDTATGDCPAADFYTGPISIEEASVDCDGNQVTFFAETIGWTSGGQVFAQETGNSSTTQWADQHDLESIDYDVCGAWDRLRRTIDDGSTLNDPTNDWQENQSTVFRCDDQLLDPDNYMTHAFAVDDIDGNQADCIIGGDDPTGLKNGDYDRVVDPTFDLGGCDQGVVTI